MILNEEKEIKLLVLNDGKEIRGELFRTITPYEVNGQMAAVIWFEVVKEGKREQRVNGTYVRQIIYY